MGKALPPDVRENFRRFGTASLLHTFERHTLAISSLAFSPSYGISFHTLASSSHDGRVVLHMFARKTSLFNELNSKNEIQVFHRSATPLNCIFGPEGVILRIVEETYIGNTETSFLVREVDGNWTEWAK